MSKTIYERTKLACYTSCYTMSSAFIFPPLLFVTLRETYGISYTLLGSLVLANFFTQLLIDLVFTAFSKHFNIHKTVKIMPLITASGLLIYALVPNFFPEYAYPGLLLGTVVFSVAAGLSEVLLSPIVAAIPSDNPQRDMSMLHSLYAFGAFTVVTLSTVFFKLFGAENWMYLAIFFATLPVIAAVMFMLSPLPDMSASHSFKKSEKNKHRAVGLAFCVACIFFGSCAENVMSNWLSGFMETALHIDKALGDILGMAMFAVLLGLARILYAAYGKNISIVLLVGMACSAVCYIIIALSANVICNFSACVLTGLFTSMLWPGMLILMEEKIPGAGVSAYAMMAAGGDFGAALAPQLMGIVVDTVSKSSLAETLGDTLNMTAEELGMKAGMLTTSVFPVMGFIILIFALRYFKKKSQSDTLN